MKVKFYSTRNCWRLVVPARFEQDGKERSYYFKTKEEGEKKIRQTLARGTSATLQLDDDEAATIQLLRNELGGSLKGLLEIVRNHRLTVLNVQYRAHLFELAEKFIARQEHEHRRPRTIDDDRQRLRKFCDALGNIDVCQISEPMVRQYIDSYPPGGNRKSHYKAVKKFLRWAHQTGYLALDVTARIKSADRWNSNNEVVDMEDFRRLLFVCAGLEPINPGDNPTTKYLALLPYFVLGGLCGMRRAEMLRDRKSQQILTWEDINWNKNLIVVPHQVAKATRASDRRRYIPLEPAAKEWLQMVVKPSGPVVDIYQSRHTQLCRELFKELEIDLPENGLRNSYASYAQSFRSPGDVAKACGDLETTIRRFYTQALEPDEGKAWFDIRRDTPRKIISLAI